jgi:hypothetical protein
MDVTLEAFSRWGGITRMKPPRLVAAAVNENHSNNEEKQLSNGKRICVYKICNK